MKVLFAVSNEEISEQIVKKYQKEYKQIISYKNVYYFNAILKELQKDKSYDRIVISEELEAFTHTQYDQIDKFIFDKLDSISDEASDLKGNDIPIIMICADRRAKSEQILVKLFGIGVYNAIIGNDRSVDEVCRLINRPRSKKDAKIYYNIDSDNVSYQSENENDVSEMEIQNIIAHYKRLGKNEERYIDSFNNIAAQYNDTQLRIISKFLPLNVRAVLEEKSQKYQQVMSFNSSVSDSLRGTKNTVKEKLGPKEVLLKTDKNEKIMSKPVVIPSAVNMNSSKKLSRMKPLEEKIEETSMKNDITDILQEIEETPAPKVKPEPVVKAKVEEPIIEGLEDFDFIEEVKAEPKRTTRKEPEVIEEPEPVAQPVKKRRGRPRKNPAPETAVETEQPVKRRRGRPRKNPLPEETNTTTKIEETSVLPGLEDDEEESFLPGVGTFSKPEESILPGLEELDSEPMLPGFDEEEDDNDFVLPGFEEEPEETMLPGLGIEDDEEEEEESYLPGFHEPVQDSFDTKIEPEPIQTKNEYQNMNYDSTPSYHMNQPIQAKVDNYETTIDLAPLLTPDKKLATFVGTSKNGTSFIVNNIATLMSSVGVNTAILDTTKNKNSYYIYTKNEEQLRNTASQCIDGLIQGVPNGIQVDSNLTVYTSSPEDDSNLYEVDKILETLVKNHSLVLIDTDFDSPVGYFKQSQETYLIQTMDVLTIQPLTAFLRDLKARNILEQEKLRIVLNKAVKIRGIKDETIIGGMAYYNDPSMSFMTELFDRDRIKFVSIPFEEETYIKYLEGVIQCEISLKGYSKVFIQNLKRLGNMLYPIIGGVPKGRKNTTYTPPSAAGFSTNMNDTLDKMKKNI